MRLGVIALARASHNVDTNSRFHLDRPLPTALLQDAPSKSRHRNGITDECIGWKACEQGKLGCNPREDAWQYECYTGASLSMRIQLIVQFRLGWIARMVSGLTSVNKQDVISLAHVIVE